MDCGENNTLEDIDAKIIHMSAVDSGPELPFTVMIQNVLVVFLYVWSMYTLYAFAAAAFI